MPGGTFFQLRRDWRLHFCISNSKNISHSIPDWDLTDSIVRFIGLLLKHLLCAEQTSERHSVSRARSNKTAVARFHIPRSRGTLKKEQGPKPTEPTSRYFRPTTLRDDGTGVTGKRIHEKKNYCDALAARAYGVDVMKSRFSHLLNVFRSNSDNRSTRQF